MAWLDPQDHQVQFLSRASRQEVFHGGNRGFHVLAVVKELPQGIVGNLFLVRDHLLLDPFLVPGDEAVGGPNDILRGAVLWDRYFFGNALYLQGAFCSYSRLP